MSESQPVEGGSPVQGVKDTKEVVKLALTVVSIVKEAKKDGKIGIEDAVLLMKLVPVVGPALDEASDVPKELKDLSTEEAAELVAYVMAELAIEDAKARLVVEKALKAAVANYELFQAVKS